MIRAFWIVISLCIASVAKAAEPTSTVFYPLPTQAQGKVFAAKQLFLADGGGVWLQDVRNQILFFDGQDIMPTTGSALEHDVDQVAFLDNAFWSFFQNEIYRTVPNEERELIFSLKPGTEIKRIGASKRFIWLADDTSFYTYDIDSGDFNTFSLLSLYQFSQSSSIQINDAKYIFSKWVLATNAGVYLSNKKNFEHVTSSGKNYVEKLYFSDKRRELIIGSLRGALIFDIQNPQKPLKKIRGSHVLSITETSQEYWIGTEKGLIVYSFLTGETKRLTSSGLNDNVISQSKIYSLLNDHSGGIWIATDRGVRYFSLFSHKFQRFSERLLASDTNVNKSGFFTRMQHSEGYWVIGDSGLYSISLTKVSTRNLVYRGTVYDLVERDGVVWLATDEGIKCINAVTGEIIADDKLPLFLKSDPIRFIELDQHGVIWGASDSRLWSYHLTSKKLTQYGAEWMIEKYLPAQLTQMIVTSQGHLVLGTEHGVYVMRDGQVHFIGESVPFGLVINIVQATESEIWVASRYGLYQFDLFSGHVKPIPLLDGHITPKCLIKNQDGIWLTSSSGLSRYSTKGQLLKHYGEPFGLISNEFSPGLCSYSTDSERTLLLGANSSLIKVNTHELVVSRLPDIKVIIGQVKVNQDLRSLGDLTDEGVELDYGESISFQFGVLPQVNKVNLEYRLNNDEWQLLDGYTLNIEHLMPGEYHFEVRAVLNESERGQSSQFVFRVAKPWFMTTYALLTYLVLLVLVIASVVYWRSRIMTKVNRQLKAQVALKTNQLRHQSRILLSNNQQLRKQLHIRRLIVNQSIEAMKERLNGLAVSQLCEQNASSQKMRRYLSEELDLLLHVRTTDGEARPVYNLNLILQSVLNGWEEELHKAGIHVDFVQESEQESYVSLTTFNLDELLNLLLDSITKRCYRNQTVVFSIRNDDDQVILSVMDQGDGLDGYNHSSVLQTISTLVELSGGTTKIHTSEERNLFEMLWQGSDSFDEESIIDVSPADECLADVVEDPWLDKVKGLVEENYSDPEFGTSTAAKKLFVSERSLQRRVKSSIEKTFTEYLTEVRLDNACRRLLAGEKVSDVAFECGFNDPSYFSQRFKHRFGVPPSQFVEEHES
ncbi:helix-turn-helix domain-containing protein [Vibrio atypicus]|uniref:helix-turn-helix domain-containing protein n=1 Tax=Vibrio atypicus TaxID=558271 RepID=UPI001CEC4E80|nr:helix-turn-helix domain-containing protein [Vibrio atypicus]